MWLSGWTYRKKITISGSSGAGTGYQVLLKVGESSGASGCDFHVEGHSENFPSDKNQSGDLRFTSSDGETLLPFWVEKVEGSSPNRVAYCWVKVNDNLDNDVDVFCYYGNSSASNVSNVSDTFIREIDGVVGSWHFDEGSGTTAYDSSGNNNDGTINGATWVDGKFGKALSFDGVDDYVHRNTFAGTPGSYLTICAWIKTTASMSYICSLNRSPSNSQNLFGFRVFNKKLQFWDRSTDSGFSPSQSSSTSVSSGTWRFVCFVKSTTTGKYYIDGQFDSEVTADVDVQYGSNDFVVGKDYEENDDFFSGIIDELYIYNKALTADEISDLYNNYGYTTENYPGKVLVRKYTDPEPAFSSAGSEEMESKEQNAIFFGTNF